MEMERFVRQSILYDFYGELLTEHQKRIYEDIIFHDMSYTEIAEIEGISRQGVYDLMKRCEKLLEEYEEKLKLVEKFQNAKDMVAKIQAIVKEMKEANGDTGLADKICMIEQLADAILEEY